ncbi:MAG TPA: FadR/GntR family transcriptional regulator [Jatrophihabitans sp.]|jgi:DNA-binding FadR family transcriptional regulator|nr:FadR/GntR family transcriptional regulator [Jatrophihabitans sp.]
MAAPDEPNPAPTAGDARYPAWPRRPARLATAVVEDLVDRIVSGAIPVSSALPTEPALCETFGVSRTVVREAVKSLEGMHLVRVQQGLGTRVRAAVDWDLLNPVVLAASVRHDAERSILEDLVSVRRALESQMAGQAARAASEAQLTDIETALRQVQAEDQDGTRFFRADLAFHDAIMEASGNRFARAVIRTVNNEAFRSMRYIGAPTHADYQQSNREHQEIFDQLHARDATKATRAMDNHIYESWLKRKPQD